MVFGLSFGDLLVIYVCYHFVFSLQDSSWLKLDSVCRFYTLFETPPTIPEVI